MPKAMRTCPKCNTLFHVRKNPCDCGYTFPPKHELAIPAKNGGLKPLQLQMQKSPAPVSKKMSDVDTNPAHSTDISYLQNYIADLEKNFNKRLEKMEDEVAASKRFLAKSQRDWYNFQCEKIYQKAYEHYGNQGEIYLTEDPELFDKNLKFVPPAVSNLSAEFPEEPPTEEKKEELATRVLHYLKPLNLNKEKTDV